MTDEGKDDEACRSTANNRITRIVFNCYFTMPGHIRILPQALRIELQHTCSKSSARTSSADDGSPFFQMSL